MFSAFYDYVPFGETIALTGSVLYQGANIAVSAAATGLSSLTSSEEKVPFTNLECLGSLNKLTKIIEDDEEDILTYVQDMEVLLQGTPMTIEQLHLSGVPSEIVSTMISAKRFELVDKRSELEPKRPEFETDLISVCGVIPVNDRF
jgi:chemotaxis protein CheY-P-specific phosphatase CheC